MPCYKPASFKTIWRSTVLRSYAKAIICLYPTDIGETPLLHLTTWLSHLTESAHCRISLKVFNITAEFSNYPWRVQFITVHLIYGILFLPLFLLDDFLKHNVGRLNEIFVMKFLQCLPAGLSKFLRLSSLIFKFWLLLLS